MALRIKGIESQGDLDAVLAITKQERPDTAMTYREINMRQEKIMVCRKSLAGVVGYVIWEDAAGFLAIEDVIVEKKWRRTGIGSTLIHWLMRNGGCSVMSAVVHERNLAAQLFFKSLGFRCDLILTKEAGGEDLYQFVRVKKVKGMK